MEQPKIDITTVLHPEEEVIKGAMQPVQAHDLTDLISRITPGNQHAAVNFDPAVGGEAF